MKYFILALLCTATLSVSAQEMNKEKSKSNPFRPAFWIIDGIKTDTTTIARKPLDPNNIESMSVWKGDSAVVRFGEAGRNGVIVVVTKDAPIRQRKKQP